ncbi:MAG TPA: hypothetical protein VLG12_02825 [Candidatus Saccharimonadales bacterium]|nr:hypothetical protein [Candidatus Saccharimonadales bacterium]
MSGEQESNQISEQDLAVQKSIEEKKAAQKKNSVKENQRSSDAPKTTLIAAREIAEEIVKANKEELDRLDDGELLRMREALKEGEKTASSDNFFVQLLGNEVTPALQLVEGQLQERKINPDSIAPEPYEHQLIKQWAKAYAGEKIIIHFANVKQVEKQVDSKTGAETYIIPSGGELSDFMTAAQFVAPESPTQKSQLHTLAQNLQDAAVLLAQQRKQVSTRSDGSVSSDAGLENLMMFDDAAIVELYEKGKQIEEFIKTGKSHSKQEQKRTIAEYKALREEIEQREIVPQYYRQQSQETISDELKQTAEYQKVEKLNNDRLLMFVLGKNTPTEAAEPGSFYNQWFDRIMDRGGRTPTGEIIHSETEFRTWLGDHSDQVIRRIAPFINRTALSEKLQSQQKAEKAIEKGIEQGAKEALYKAISERGKQEQQKLMDYDFSKEVSFSHEKGEEMTAITQEVFPERRLNANVAARLAALPENATLPQRLDALNQAVAETYTVPQNSTLKNYEPILALQEGEFACSIRSIVLNKLIEQYMGDDFVRLGGSEWKHSTLFMIDKTSMQEGNSPEGYHISTGGKGGYTVLKITDDMLEQPFMAKLVNAVYQDGDDVMIHLQLQPKDTALAERIGGSMTIGNVDKINESHVWINEAAAKRTLDPNEPALSPEMQLQDAQRALLLNPFSETALGLIVKLTHDNPDQEALYRTSLRKLQLLNPDLTEERVLAEEDFTVNAYQDLHLGLDAKEPILPPSGTDIDALVNDIRKEQRDLGIGEVQFMGSRELYQFYDRANRLSIPPLPREPQQPRFPQLPQDPNDPALVLRRGGPPTVAEILAHSDAMIQYNNEVSDYPAVIAQYRTDLAQYRRDLTTYNGRYTIAYKTAFTAAKDTFLKQLQAAMAEASIIDQAKEIFPNLKPVDFEALVKDPDSWYMRRSILYSELLDQEKAVDSPIVDRFNKETEEAFFFLGRYHKANPERARRLQDASKHRKNAMFLHLMLRLGVKDKIPGQAQMLGIRGISEGFAADEGRVGTAVIKLSTMLDTARNNKDVVDLLATEKAKFIADDAVKEELKLAEKGLGEYGDYYIQIQREVSSNPTGKYADYYKKYKDTPNWVMVNGQRVNQGGQGLSAADSVTRVARELTTSKLKNNFYYARDLLYCSQRFSKIASVGWGTRGQWKTDAAKLTISGENLTQYIYKWIALTEKQERVLARQEMYCTNRELMRGYRIVNGRVISRMGEVQQYTDGERMLMGEPLFNRTKNSGEILSGGWRGPEYLKAHELRLGEDISKHTQLFIKLHIASGAGDIKLGGISFGDLKGIALKKAKEQAQTLIYREGLFRGDISQFYSEEIVSQFRLHDRNWDGNNSHSELLRKGFVREWGQDQYNKMLANDVQRNRSFNNMMNESLFVSFGNPNYADPSNANFGVIDPKDSRYSSNDQRSVAQYRYDQFRAKYDNVMSSIRQMAIMQMPPMQVDFANLNSLILEVPDSASGVGTTKRISAADIVRDYFTTTGSNGTAEVTELQAVMQRFKTFSREDRTVETLLYDKTFEDIYHRVLRMDDARIDLYEQQRKLKRDDFDPLTMRPIRTNPIPLNPLTGLPVRDAVSLLVDSSGGPIPIDPLTGRPVNSAQNNAAVWEDDTSLSPVSSKFAADPSGESLERAWGDKLNSVAQGDAEIDVVSIHPNDPDKITKAKEAANFKKQVDGWPGYIEALQPQIEQLLADSQTPELAKLLGISHLPPWMNIAITKHQEIFGVKTTGITAEEAVTILDELSADFTGTEAEKEEAEQYINELRSLVSVAPNDILRRRLILMGLASLLAVALSGLAVMETGVQMEVGK